MKQNKGLVLFVLYLICSSALIDATETIAGSTPPSQRNYFSAELENFGKNGAISSFLETDFQESSENSAFATLELNEKIELELKNKFLEQLKLFNGRKRRYTEDNRLCAAAFVQDGQTYYDCTTSKSPDGQLKNREWCYVNPGEKGKVWGYCKPVMNYDKVREANQQLLREITTECRKVNSEIEVHIPPAEDALNHLRKTREGQADLDNKVNLLVREVETIKNNLANLYSIKAEWEKEETRVIDLHNKIKKKKDDLREKGIKTKEYYDNSDDTIRSESQIHNQKLSGVLQIREKIKEKCCDGKLLYEEEKEGDGLKGFYFDNEAWLGSFQERKDNEINFNWTGASPKKGINANNFSARWTGFLYAPYTGKYTFAIECDDGAALTINNELIISHNMHTAAPENYARTERWLNNEINKRANPNKNPFKSYSQKIHLTGGSKYKYNTYYVGST